VTTPIVFFTDSIAANSGLARIGRDLATKTHEHLGDTFRVATLGYGHCGSSKFPFPQYHWNQRDDFLPLELPYIWRDFCGDDPGILFTIGDIQRFLALADTQFSMDRNFAQWMPEMRQSGKLKLWGYFPVDAHNKDGKLGSQLGHTLSHYDRRLVPSEWAKGICERTVPGIAVEAIPHGVDTSTFHPYPKEDAREKIGQVMAPVLQWPMEPVSVVEDALWIGIVATNQNRKSYSTGVKVVSELAKTRPVFFWIHTDRMKAEWSILELLSDYGLLQCSMVTVGNVSDEAMAIAYSAMDVTLGIGRGEGYGYPIMESWFCGTPCVAGSYGAHAEFIPDRCLVKPRMMQLEGPLNLLRPIFEAEDWFGPINDAVGNPSPSMVGLDWKYLWQDFEKWLKAGLA